MSVHRVALVVFYFHTAHFVTKHLLALISPPYMNQNNGQFVETQANQGVSAM